MQESGQNNSNTIKPSPPQVRSAILKSVEHLTSTYYVYTFEATQPISYIPGQHINVYVKENLTRAYSFATTNNPNEIKILITTSPGGPGSQFFLNLKPNDKIDFFGPVGVFRLHSITTDKIIFLATGAGISPLEFMVDSLLAQNSEKEIYLYFGLRSSDDIFWNDRLTELAYENPNFNYKLAVSQPNDDYKGYKGYNIDFLNQDFTDCSNCTAYLCGNPDMIIEGTKNLIQLGCLSDNIYKERFYK